MTKASLQWLTFPNAQIGTPNMKRLATRVRSVSDAELWNTMLLLLPGSISVYYGDEIGMTDSDKVRETKN